MSYSIKHLYHINAPLDKVFEAISTIEGLANWWTIDTTGNDALDGVIKFRFSSNGGPDMKVVELKQNEKVSWECVESNHGWKGNRFNFLIDENDGKTRVKFSHEDWPAQDDFFAICNFAWGR